MKQIVFDETLESLQKIFVLAKHIDITIICQTCGEQMTLIGENDSVEKDGKHLKGPGLFCPNGHISMLWTPPPPSDIKQFWEEFEHRSKPNNPLPMVSSFDQAERKVSI
jgi:hypothetical protein